MEKEKTPVEIIFEEIKKGNIKALLQFEEIILEKESNDKAEAYKKGQTDARIEFLKINAH